MLYHIYTPQPRLAPYIKCYWSLEGNEIALAGTTDRIFPDGCMELVFHYGDRFKKHATGLQSHYQPLSFIHGQLTTFIDIEATGKTGIFSVRFQPNGLKVFSSHYLPEITGDNINLNNFWGQEGEQLQDEILHAHNHLQRINIIETFLLRQLARHAKHDDRVNYALKLINHNHGQININQLAYDLNVSRRQLERRFTADVGLSPKLFARINRFQHTLQQIESSQNTLTGIAHQSGFYDQAHFIKDFKEFTGLKPMQYFGAELPLVKYFGTK